MKYYILLISLVVLSGRTLAQNYSAIHGSHYSGSLGVYNNPASIANTTYKWDVTLFGMQYQTITNAVRGSNFPFNLSPSGKYYAATGDYKRSGDLNFNTRLLNTRIALNPNSAVAFGINLRGYAQVNTSQVNYNDSIFGPRTFLSYNEVNRPLAATVTSSLWMEVYLAYARTIWNNDISALRAGGTLKILRGMSGGFADIEEIDVQSARVNDQNVWLVSQGTGRYGYSANHGNGDSFSAGDLFSGSKTGFAVDLGIEYLVKDQAPGSVFDENEEASYEWKIGVSLLDIGWNKFAYSNASRTASQFRDSVSSETLRAKFDEVENVTSFNDSVATLVNNFDTLTGTFGIWNPARAVVNVDRYVSGNFFVNAELSLNLASGGNKKFAVKEARLLTVTPRWETRKLGFYMPMQLTRHGNFWIGGAVKLGPVLLGTHNLLNAFSKNKYVAGGAYLAVTIRPSNIMRSARVRQYDCPEY